MKKLFQFILIWVIGFQMIGCNGVPNATSEPKVQPTQNIPITPSSSMVIYSQTVKSEKQRITTPQASPSDVENLVASNNAFASDLYQNLIQEKDGNVFFSPYSISLALAMTYAAARGETATQMARTLHFDLAQERLHPAFNDLDLYFASLGKGAQGSDHQGFRLHIVNALWGQKDFQFLQDFLDLLAQNYGAGIRLLDFAGNPDASRITINDWVSEQTEGKIKDLIPPGAIDALTRLVLTNAIYFNAAWAHPFEEKQTSPAPFYLLDGSQINVPMMQTTTSLSTFAGEGYQGVAIPYDGNELEMVIIMPQAGKFEQIEKELTAAWITSEIAKREYHQVELHMPKFKVESDFSLVKALSELGMPLAFTDQADFSGMDGKRDLYIGEVVHKAYVSVNETGTEAAAATAVVMELTAAMPEKPIQISLDHPFFFFIRDIQYGSILFAGRLLDPTK
ncbi:MAG: serpin family protein [Anaerolineales bacterium]